MMAVAVFDDRKSHRVYQKEWKMHTNTQKGTFLKSCIITKLGKKGGKKTEIDKIHVVRSHRRPVNTM